jgi:hypothetical protein
MLLKTIAIRGNLSARCAVANGGATSMTSIALQVNARRSITDLPRRPMEVGQYYASKRRFDPADV